MTQAILAFYNQNIWSKKCTRQTKQTFHWILQVIGSSSAIIGIIVEYIGRSKKSKAHFSSTHSIIGLIAGILTLITMFGGISALWSIKLKQYARPICFKLAHHVSGIIVFLLGKSPLQKYNFFFIKFKLFEYYDLLAFFRNDCSFLWV